MKNVNLEGYQDVFFLSYRHANFVETIFMAFKQVLHAIGLIDKSVPPLVFDH